MWPPWQLHGVEPTLHLQVLNAVDAIADKKIMQSWVKWQLGKKIFLATLLNYKIVQYWQCNFSKAYFTVQLWKLEHILFQEQNIKKLKEKYKKGNERQLRPCQPLDVYEESLDALLVRLPKWLVVFRFHLTALLSTNLTITKN